MSDTIPPPTSDPGPGLLGSLRRWGQAWDRFWFTPASPTLLAWIRIGAGLIALYVFIAFTLDFEEFFGVDGWLNLKARLEHVREIPVYAERWDWVQPSDPNATLQANTPWEVQYLEEYKREFGDYPPLPFPESEAEAQYFARYRHRWGIDPRLLLTQGIYAWSLWFHITDPIAMRVIHGVIIVIAFLFTIGFCTRITAVLTWMAQLTYIHRTPIILFGFDTMLLITLMYMMIAPCGSCYAVDRLLRRWWQRNGPRVIHHWRTFWARLGLGEAPNAELPPPVLTPLPPVQPSVSAGFTIRLFQVHLCIIYAAAGLAKLKGASWWTGIAVWGTLANPEFAPMYSEWYMTFLNWLASNRLRLELVLTTGTFFTLFFEICYPFLIWHRSTRWLILCMAVLLHGFIGLFMGLKTFALIMLVMNFVFLPQGTITWLEEQGRKLRLALLWYADGNGGAEGREAGAARPPTEETTRVGHGHLHRRS